MPWFAVLPLIVDSVRAVIKMIYEIEDPADRRVAKQDLKDVLGDYRYHGDVSTLKSNLEQVGK